MIVISLLAAAIPMILYMTVLWRLDKYDREPFRYVMASFLWGAVGAILLASLASWLLNEGLKAVLMDASGGERLLGPLVFAPLVEESAKGIFLFFLARSKVFDNITDGLIYGGAIGLGFGMTENFLYFITYGNTLASWVFLVFVRTSFSALMHCISTASLGTFLAIARFGKAWTKVFAPVMGFFVAMTIHFIWNFTVSFRITLLLGILFIMFAVTAFITVFMLSIYNERRIILKELDEEVKASLVPEGHPRIIASKERYQKGWIDEAIRKDYIKALTRLAFRKKQFRQTTGKEQQFYAREVELLRSLIRDLLINSQF
ncbi:MAG: PrsW family intramembrane metalloprotease [Ignavibacteria bacterium]|jgi:RsiW-degrading membrane proteinase PrsW (M82 family)|nr:PrsW family intramembrane metalloprotease [Ignavibacteria bacterium]MCU7505116.1 PrsW family intramembrane metalloprotease [Ignavibacteria bacterium]MCU7517509.1 PrsW family intramembrane metalloprotease [Ignavibacteria bacterium]